MYITCSPLEKLLRQKKAPALFIGSGFSKRYLEGFMTWRELLYALADKLKVDHFVIDVQITTYLSDGKSEGQAYQLVGSYLEGELNSQINSGTAKDIFDEEDIAKIAEGNIIPFKYLVSKLIPSDCKFRSFDGQSYLQTELHIFKQLVEKVPCIITTNYDNLIETLFESRYKVFCSQSDYFYAPSTLQAEIYKIHGSVTDPNTIVLTQKDYDNFLQQSFLSTAKLLEVLCERPIVFIGYSMSDENIRRILENLISCLNKEQLLALQDNLLLIEWTPHERKMNYNSHEISLGNKTLKVTFVQTDNYTLLYKYLLKFQPSVTPLELRKFHSTIKNLIIHNNDKLENVVVKYQDLLATPNIESIDNLAITGVGAAKEGYGKIPTTSIVLDYLFEKEEYNYEDIMNTWFISCCPYNALVPLYYYKWQCDKNKVFLNEKALEKFNKYTKHKERINFNVAVGLKNLNTRDLIENKYNSLEKISIIMNLYQHKTIKWNAARQYLRKVYNADNDVAQTTEFRKAVVILDRDANKDKIK